MKEQEGRMHTKGKAERQSEVGVIRRWLGCVWPGETGQEPALLGQKKVPVLVYLSLFFVVYGFFLGEGRERDERDGRGTGRREGTRGYSLRSDVNVHPRILVVGIQVKLGRANGTSSMQMKTTASCILSRRWYSVYVQYMAENAPCMSLLESLELRRQRPRVAASRTAVAQSIITR